jgi:hypothetical protein
MSRRSQIGLAGLALLAAVALLALPAAPASAQCGGVNTAKAQKKVNPKGRPPLAIGDSTILLALPSLARIGYNVNGHGCRQMTEGLHILKDLRRHGRLPHLVVIALGADASISAAQVERAFHFMGHKRVLGLVTPRELGGGSGHDADVVRHEARRHPKRAVLLDWVDYSAGHGGWFQPDGLHLTFDGADAFTRLLRQALPYARAGHHPKRATARSVNHWLRLDSQGEFVAEAADGGSISSLSPDQAAMTPVDFMLG